MSRQGGEERNFSQFARVPARHVSPLAVHERIAGMRLFPLGVVLVMSVALTAACGGGSTTYTVDATRACLKEEGVRIVPVPGRDLVASAADGGSFLARFRNNTVTVSFGVDRDGAERIVRAYQRFHGANIGLEDVLKPKQNVVMLWEFHPQDAYVATIEGCLK
jgi:hypothetical protein